jgi:hypothetical protein
VKRAFSASKYIGPYLIWQLVVATSCHLVSYQCNPVSRRQSTRMARRGRNWQITTVKFVRDLTHGSVLDIHTLYSCNNRSSHHYLAPGVTCHSTSFVRRTAHWKQCNLKAVAPLSYKHSTSQHCAPTSLYSEQVSWHLNFMLTFVSSWNRLAMSRVCTKQSVTDNIRQLYIYLKPTVLA